MEGIGGLWEGWRGFAKEGGLWEGWGVALRRVGVLLMKAVSCDGWASLQWMGGLQWMEGPEVHRAHGPAPPRTHKQATVGALCPPTHPTHAPPIPAHRSIPHTPKPEAAGTARPKSPRPAAPAPSSPAPPDPPAAGSGCPGPSNCSTPVARISLPLQSRPCRNWVSGAIATQHFSIHLLYNSEGFKDSISWHT